MTKPTITDEYREYTITATNHIPSYLQIFDGDSIIKIGRDCSLELGLGWADHNEAATAFFNQLIEHVMPAWKKATEQAAFNAGLERAAVIAARSSRLTDEQAKHYGDGPHLIAAAIRAERDKP